MIYWTPQPELECDELVQLAAAICGTSMGLVTLLDERHQWYRASEHLKLGETPREVAFCAHAIRQTELFLVKDALMDPRFDSDPLVTSDPAIRFLQGWGYLRLKASPSGHFVWWICRREYWRRSRPMHSRCWAAGERPAGGDGAAEGPSRGVG